MKSQKSHRGITGIIAALLTLCLVVPAAAQPNSHSDGWHTLLAAEGDWTLALRGEAIPAGLSGLDLDSFSKDDWKELRKDQVSAIRRGSSEEWEKAVQNVIYLSTAYGDRVTFDHVSLPLLETYTLDRDETRRIMALAAMHAIGHRDTMARLSQKVFLEASPRVRRLTAAAVVDYFGAPDGTVEVGKIRPAAGGQ